MLRPALLALALALTSCGPQSGTDVGNGRTALNLRGYDGAASTRSLTLANGVVVESLHVVVEHIRMQPGTQCEEDDGRIDIEGPLVADIVGAGILGGVAEFEIVAGAFCLLRLDYHRLEPDDSVPAAAPDALVGHAIRMVGRRPDGSTFVVESELAESLELEAHDGAFTLGAAAHSLLVAYDVGAWVRALALDTLPAGNVLINETSNRDRLDAFEAAVRLSATLFRDADGNGEVTLADEPIAD